LSIGLLTILPTLSRIAAGRSPLFRILLFAVALGATSVAFAQAYPAKAQ